MCQVGFLALPSRGSSGRSESWSEAAGVVVTGAGFVLGSGRRETGPLKLLPSARGRVYPLCPWSWGPGKPADVSCIDVPSLMQLRPSPRPVRTAHYHLLFLGPTGRQRGLSWWEGVAEPQPSWDGVTWAWTLQVVGESLSKFASSWAVLSRAAKHLMEAPTCPDA